MEHAGGEIGATPDEKEPWWMMWNLRGQRQEIFLRNQWNLGNQGNGI